MSPHEAIRTPHMTTTTQIPRLVFNGDACRACRACEAACSLTHEGAVSPSLARITIAFDEFAEQAMVTASFCLQCDDAPCINACPVEAMARHPRTGAVTINAETCIGCMRCAKACPWGIPKRHPDERLAIKCDLCSDVQDGPACVRFCPLASEALTVATLSAGETNQ